MNTTGGMDSTGALSSERLRGIRRGIEKESLRALPSGSLALTPHPAALGSAPAGFPDCPGFQLAGVGPEPFGRPGLPFGLLVDC